MAIDCSNSDMDALGISQGEETGRKSPPPCKFVAYLLLIRDTSIPQGWHNQAVRVYAI